MRAGSQAGEEEESRWGKERTGTVKEHARARTHTGRNTQLTRVQYSNSSTECWLQLILTSKFSSLLPLGQSVCKCDSRVSVEAAYGNGHSLFYFDIEACVQPGRQADKQAGAIKWTTKTFKKKMVSVQSWVLLCHYTHTTLLFWRDRHEWANCCHLVTAFLVEENLPPLAVPLPLTQHQLSPRSPCDGSVFPLRQGTDRSRGSHWWQVARNEMMNARQTGGCLLKSVCV